MHFHKIFYSRLSNCPENQLRKVHHPFRYFDYDKGTYVTIPKSDAGWDLAAAEDIIIKPYGNLEYENEFSNHVVEKEQIQIRLKDGSVETRVRFKYNLQLIRTGICIRPEYLGFFDIRPRSGFSGKYGLGIVNSPGTIDASYQGELAIVAYSLLPFQSIPIKRGEFIAQIVPQYQIHCEFIEVEYDELIQKESVRQNKGFGSTGI
jgi:deoxyuridine 5'-triphosphate nucleotidohydrolase